MGSKLKQGTAGMNLTSQIYNSVRDSHQPRPIELWHASSIAKCPRALYFERLGVKALSENQAGPGKMLRWQAGHLMEAVIRPHLQSIYPNLVTNVRFTNDKMQLTGEFDGYDPDSKTLISVKSVHDFAMITRDGVVGLKEKVGVKISPRTGKEVGVYDLKTEPYIHHQWQEAAYVLLLDSPMTKMETDYTPELRIKDGDPWPVEQIAYVYITLGGLLTTFKTPRSDFIVKRVSKKLKYLNDVYTQREMPICTCHKSQEMFAEQNQYCDYRTEDGCCDVKLLETIKEKISV